MAAERDFQPTQDQQPTATDRTAGDAPGRQTRTDKLDGPRRLIEQSVGEGGRNDPRDVAAVQRALARQGFWPNPVDGQASAKLFDAIKAFQSRFVDRADGLIEVGSASDERLRSQPAGRGTPRTDEAEPRAAAATTAGAPASAPGPAAAQPASAPATNPGGNDALGRKENMLAPFFADMQQVAAALAPKFAELGLQFRPEILLSTALQEAAASDPLNNRSFDNGLGIMQITPYRGKLDPGVAQAIGWDNNKGLEDNIRDSNWRNARANLTAGAETMLGKARAIRRGVSQIWDQMDEQHRWRAVMFAYNAGEGAAIKALRDGGANAPMISTFTRPDGQVTSHDYTAEITTKTEYVESHDPFAAQPASSTAAVPSPTSAPASSNAPAPAPTTTSAPAAPASASPASASPTSASPTSASPTGPSSGSSPSSSGGASPTGPSSTSTPTATPAGAHALTASVGRHGANHKQDVLRVQRALRAQGVDPGPLDGVVGDRTIAAIEQFQRRFMRHADGVIQLNQVTAHHLFPTTAPAPAARPPQTSMPAPESSSAPAASPTPAAPAVVHPVAPAAEHPATPATEHPAAPATGDASLRDLMAQPRLTAAQIAQARELIAAEPETNRAPLYRELQSKVVYANQRDNDARDASGAKIETASGNMCNLTSLAMCLQYLGVPNPHPEMQYEDALEKVRQEKRLPARTTEGGWGGVASAVGVQHHMLAMAGTHPRSWWSGTVGGALASGQAVMMSITGHIVRVQAVTEGGVVVDDPYGHERMLAGTGHQILEYNKKDATGTAGEDNLWTWEQIEPHSFLWIAAFARG